MSAAVQICMPSTVQTRSRDLRRRGFRTGQIALLLDIKPAAVLQALEGQGAQP